MSNYNTRLGSRDTYSKYYGDFRGVDLSSDHALVNERRFSYAVNMYKDYLSGQSTGIETIPGFRKRVVIPDGSEIYGIHYFRHKDDDGNMLDKVLIHAGTKLYLWSGYPLLSAGVLMSGVAPLKNNGSVSFTVDLSGFNIGKLESVRVGSDNEIFSYTLSEDKKTLSFTSYDTSYSAGDPVEIKYYESELDDLKVQMNARKSISFIFNNRLYIIDGKSYLVYDGSSVSNVLDNAFIPTTRARMVPANAPLGKFSFGGTIGDKWYDFERGMTWRDFINSHYNDALELYPVDGKYVGIASSDITEDPPSENAKHVIYLEDLDMEAGTILYGPIKLDSKIYSSSQYKYDYIDFSNQDNFTEIEISDDSTEADAIPGANSDNGIELYQRNLCTNSVKNTFIATGETSRYYLSENNIDNIVSIKAYGKEIDQSIIAVNTELGYVDVLYHGKNSFPKPADAIKIENTAYPEDYAGVEIIFTKKIKSAAGVTLPVDENGISIGSSALITGCTIVTIYDGRVFLSGNPLCPNTIFWCGANDTGFIDPTYFGILDNHTDGLGLAPIVGMMPVSDTLLVLKADSLQDGCFYFHTPYETGESVTPVIYPSSQGLNGVGCIGACTNFLDDPVFISRLGLDAVGQLSVRLERGREHRSSLIDAELLRCDLSKAVIEEWKGYLFVLVEGKIFLADSRQRFANELGNSEYEWYYLEDIGVYDGQYHACRYASELPPVLEGATVDGMPLEIASEVYDPYSDSHVSLVGRIANTPKAGKPSESSMEIRLETVSTDGNGTITFPCAIYESTDSYGNSLTRAFLVEESDEYIGGTFSPAVMLKAIGDNIYFWTKNGTVCSFNFDMRDKNGVMPNSAYTFDGRAIFSGCATKMDNCGIPHLTKTTVKKSTVIKLGALDATAAKIKVRTNREPYKQIARINSSTFSFEDLNFADLSFLTEAQGFFTVKEKEKKWVEKQYFIYSDEYKKPFALFYAAYRYYVAGRYKNQ